MIHLSFTRSATSGRSLFSALVLMLSACTAAPDEGNDDGSASWEGCTESTEVTCRSDAFVGLNMSLDELAVGDVENVPEDDGSFTSNVDASSNGAFNDGPWLYARFSEDGLVKVELGDDESFDSMDWDLSFQRFSIRLNSGDGGPSCVSAARMPAGTVFEELDALPQNTELDVEDFMNEADGCSLIPDTSGQGSAGVRLQNWWEYPGCVKTTGNVYAIGLADGSVIKLVVTRYYGSGQEGCNENGIPGTQSAQIQMRWAYL